MMNVLRSSAWLLVALRGTAAAARALPHVTDAGVYDTSWHATRVDSLDDTRTLAPPDGWRSVMLAGLDDVEPEAPPACADAHEKCEFWASVDECDKNPKYMRDKCAKACGSCATDAASCGRGAAAEREARVALRQAQRTLPQRFMATAIARRSTWRGAWPFDGDRGRACGAALLKPRDDWDTTADRIQANFSDGGALRMVLSELAGRGSRADPFRVTNGLDREVTLHWFDAGQEEGLKQAETPYKQVATLKPGEGTGIGSFVGHIFAVADAEGRFLAQTIVRGAGDSVTVDEALLADAETCSATTAPHDPLAAAGQAAEMARLEGLGGPEGRDARVRFAVLERVRDLALEKRKALSDVQISLTPNVTTDGFRLIKTPARIYDQVAAWYNRSHLTHRVAEGDGGPLYNQHQVTTWHTPLPPSTKRFVFDELQKLMEEWAPTTAPLKGTSAYGVRTYEPGSYLHLHVDTANTHVVSGIMNVAQDLGENGTDWPLEILDHGGTLHAVNMKPGDFLLYESARLLHGRPSPFSGKSYANIFVHYMPQNGWSVNF